MTPNNVTTGYKRSKKPRKNSAHQHLLDAGNYISFIYDIPLYIFSHVSRCCNPCYNLQRATSAQKIPRKASVYTILNIIIVKNLYIYFMIFLKMHSL